MPAKSPRKSVTRKTAAKKAVRKAPPKKTASKPGQASGADAKEIAARLRDTKDWRNVVLARMRALIIEAVPDVVEEIKWRKPSNGMQGVLTWSQGGLICTGETYKDKVKLTFAKGAALADPKKVFNAGFDGGTRRAIDIPQGGKVNEAAFKALVAAAAELNGGAASTNDKAGTTKRSAPKDVQLLSGGNPRIAKADGNAPVQAYIDAMPGWKRAVGARLDALVEKSVPGVRKAVKWNSPFYGMPGQGWFMSFHVFTNFVKVTFFRGTALRPPVKGGTGKDARWIDIHESDLDEAQMAAWIRQAAELPGWGNS